jgi:hypothetical protein
MRVSRHVGRDSWRFSRVAEIEHAMIKKRKGAFGIGHWAFSIVHWGIGPNPALGASKESGSAWRFGFAKSNSKGIALGDAAMGIHSPTFRIAIREG